MAETERDLQPVDCAIIHNIYDNGSAREHFEFELDQALEAKRSIIIIEPAHLGDETARWITVGNCLHKTSVLSGMACLVAPALLPNQAVNFITFPTGTVSVACALLYGVSWQSDPCCKYQVEYDTRNLSRLPLHSLTTATPIVLVRKDDKYRKALHNLVAGLAAALLAYKVYQWCTR